MWTETEDDKKKTEEPLDEPSYEEDEKLGQTMMDVDMGTLKIDKDDKKSADSDEGSLSVDEMLKKEKSIIGGLKKIFKKD